MYIYIYICMYMYIHVNLKFYKCALNQKKSKKKNLKEENFFDWAPSIVAKISVCLWSKPNCPREPKPSVVWVGPNPQTWTTEDLYKTYPSDLNWYTPSNLNHWSRRWSAPKKRPARQIWQKKQLYLNYSWHRQIQMMTLRSAHMCVGIHIYTQMKRLYSNCNWRWQMTTLRSVYLCVCILHTYICNSFTPIPVGVGRFGWRLWGPFMCVNIYIYTLMYMYTCIRIHI